MKAPKEWTLETVQPEESARLDSFDLEMFAFYTKRGHELKCYIRRQEGKMKSADTAAQQFLQHLEIQGMKGFTAKSSALVGSNSCIFDSFEIEFEAHGQKHWIVALEDTKHQRILVWHYVAPSDDYDKPLATLFLSTLNSSARLAKESVEVEVEDDLDPEESATEEERQHHYAQDPKSFEGFQDTPFADFFDPKNIEQTKRLMQDKNLMNYMSSIVEKMHSLTAQDFEQFKSSPQYHNSRDVREFMSEFQTNQTLAIMKHGTKPEVRSFFTNVIIPVVLVK